MMQEEDKDYLQQLNKAYIESSSQFDKQILFLASGALGLSFAFIKDIVKLAEATYKWILIVSWSLFIIVIFLNIISHYTSLKAIKNKTKNINEASDKQSDHYDSVTKRLNICMVVLLGIALVFLILFVGINL